MDLLLDTHTLLWLAEGDAKRLSSNARMKLENTENTRYVSMATFWEIGIKLSTGKLELKKGFESIVNFCADMNFRFIPITIEHIKLVKDLPFIHRDPFDRLLVAQASVESLTLVSADKNISQYLIKTIW